MHKGCFQCFGGLTTLPLLLFWSLAWRQCKFDPLQSCHVGPDLLMVTDQSIFVQGVNLQHKLLCE